MILYIHPADTDNAITNFHNGIFFSFFVNFWKCIWEWSSICKQSYFKLSDTWNAVCKFRTVQSRKFRVCKFSWFPWVCQNCYITFENFYLRFPSDCNYNFKKIFTKKHIFAKFCFLKLVSNKVHIRRVILKIPAILVATLEQPFWISLSGTARNQDNRLCNQTIPMEW